MIPMQFALVLLLCFAPLTNADVLRMSKDFVEEQEKVKEPVGSYIITDADGLGRTFDGIGGLSGGGATSRLLVNYAEPYRSQILDYLFKPNFAASLHILKVEIGGDSQSTDGTEPSHMHTPNDLNFTRGYEWWLMKEAKKRNPDIKLIGLPWAWPAWIAEGYTWPYQNVDIATKYIVNWIQGAKSEHGLDIDYVGIWNEKPYTVNYIIALRKALDAAGFNSVKIIAADQARFWPIVHAASLFKELNESIDIFGAHYPGTVDSELAKNSGKPLWSSEDYSTYDDDVGAGCWARLLNRNYVNGKMTATIAWNLVASYYDALPFNRSSLLTASQPWSGHYEVVNAVWITAHTTQFTQPGWSYLKSVGKLEKGGTYVSLTDKRGEALTIIIETMTHDMSVCVRPPLPPYEVEPQTAVFTMQGSFNETVKQLQVWETVLEKVLTPTSNVFAYKGIVTVNTTGSFEVTLQPNTVVTLTTVDTGEKGTYPYSPPPARFPFPYKDNFDGPNNFSEPDNFADQSGVFETFYNESSKDGHQQTMRQVILEKPIPWCDDSEVPISIIGDHSWKTVNVSVDAKIETTTAVFVAARVDKGGCEALGAKGAFLWLFRDFWVFSTDINRANVHKQCTFVDNCWNKKFLSTDDWHSLSIAITTSHVIGNIDGVQIFSYSIEQLESLPQNGWAGLGTSTFGYAQFDNFIVN